MDFVTRGLAKLLMWDAATVFDNVTQVVNAIREAGFGYRNQEMWRDTRNIFEIVNKPAGGPEDWLFELYPKANMPEVEWKGDRLYMVHGWATYEDGATGELTRRRVSLYTDNYSEGFSYLSELQMVDDSKARYQGQKAVDFEPSVMWHKRGESYSAPRTLSEI